MLTIIEIFLIAVAMSVDAFSVAFGIGCSYNTPRHYFRLSWHFGLFQFIMPILGAFLGRILLTWIGNINIIAALILFYIAYRMVKESFKDDEQKCSLNDPTRGWSLVVLSVATSMDALGVGVSLALYKGSIIFPSLIIGIVCAIGTLMGVYFGKISRHFTGKYAELFGATVLVVIGIKFLVV